MEALAWIGDLIQSLGTLIPRLWVLCANEVGVKFVRGKRVKVCGPGIHFYWPLLTDILSCSSAQQTMEVEAITLMIRHNSSSKKWATVIAGCVVVFKVTDARSYLVDVVSANASVAEIAQGALRQAIITHTIDDIQGDQESVDTLIHDSIQQDVTEYGIEVLRARLSSFSTAQVINCVGVSPVIFPDDDDE